MLNYKSNFDCDNYCRRMLGFLLFVLNKTLVAEKNVNCWKMSPYPLEVMNPGKLFLLWPLSVLEKWAVKIERKRKKKAVLGDP